MKRQFFTLVELLLVIAIIAILAGIAIPVVGGMNKKGKETKARSEINAIITESNSMKPITEHCRLFRPVIRKMISSLQKPILPPKQQVGDMTMLMMK